MEYVSGGDLMMHIQRQVFSEHRARYMLPTVIEMGERDRDSVCVCVCRASRVRYA
jgi:hypothetical protein